MGRYIQLSRCYFDDKDISDILTNSEFTTRYLLAFARSRGVFLSNKEERSNIIRYLSRQNFTWKNISEFASKLNREDPEERQSVRRIEGVPSLDKVERAVTLVKEERATKEQEVYSVRKMSASVYEVSFSYVELDTAKQKAFQRRQRDAKIELELKGGTLDVRHQQSERSKAVVTAIVERLKTELQSHLRTTAIELTGVRDAAKRTGFFLSMRQRLDGFRPVDVLDLRVSNRFPDMKEGESEPEEDTEEAAEAKSLVKSAALNGKGLLTTELYRKLQETGYFLTSMIWSSRELSGESRLVEFEAGFGNPVDAADFYFDVKKVYPRDDEKEKRSLGELLRSERSRLRRIVEKAAYEALAEIGSKEKREEAPVDK